MLLIFFGSKTRITGSTTLLHTQILQQYRKKVKLPEFDPILDEAEEMQTVETAESEPEQEAEAPAAQTVSPETEETLPCPETPAVSDPVPPAETASAAMKQPHPWVKRVLSIVLAAVAAVLLASFVLAFCFEDKVADAVLTRVYRLVDTEVRHDGVSLNLWRKFPNVTVEVHGLTVEAHGKDRDLARIRRLYLQFNLFDIIRGNYRLKKAEIQHVDLNLHTYADATHSWDIFTPEEDTSESAFSLQLSALQLSHADVRYLDETSGIRCAADVKRIGVKGDFTQEKFTVKYTTQLQLRTLDVDTSFHWKDAQLKSGGEVDVNLKDGRYLFKQCALNVGKESVQLDGSLHLQADSSWRYALRAEAGSLSVAGLLAELPEALRNAAEGYRIGGLLQLKLSADGSLGEDPTLHLKADAAVRNAEVWQQENRVGLQQAAFAAHVEAATPDLLSSMKISVKDFRAELPSGNAQARLQLENLSAPHVRADLQSELRLQDLKAFLPRLSAYRMGGNAVVNLHFENTFPGGFAMDAESFRQAKLSGNLRLEDGLFQMDTSALRMEDFVAQLMFSDQMVTVTRFDGKIQGNGCRLSAKISPALDFLFSDESVLDVSATLTSPYVNVDAFMPSSSASSSSASSSSASDAAFVLPERVRAEVKVAADKVKYDRLEATRLKGVLRLKDLCLSLQDFSMEALGGKARLRGEARPGRNGSYLLEADAHTDKVDIQRLFYVMHDFGQEPGANSLTHENIRGRATSDIRFSASLDSELELLPESIGCDADLTVSDGRLVNYKVLEGLSSFVSIEDLKDIRFETLKNKISIRNSVIQIPEMEIRNSLVNLYVSGNQSFDGNLHYNIKMHVNELLARKRRNRVRSEEFGTVEDDDSKGMYLYLLVAGTTDNPEFKWNREKAREGLRENLQSQRDELRSIFSSERNKPAEQPAASGTRQPATPAQQRREEKKRLNDSRQKPSELEVGDDW